MICFREIASDDKKNLEKNISLHIFFAYSEYDKYDQ